MFQKNIDRLIRLDHLIKRKSTGSPLELANKMEISERSLYEYISLLKRLNAPIKYCKTRQSYYYTSNGYFFIGFKEI